MLEGMTIKEMASQLTKINEKKVDLIVLTSRLFMNDGAIEIAGEGSYGNGSVDTLLKPTTWAHNQISTFTGVPKKYYDILKETNIGLLSSCVNHGLQMAINAATARKNASPET